MKARPNLGTMNERRKMRRFVPGRCRHALATLHAAEPSDIGFVAARLERVGQRRRGSPDCGHRLVDRAVFDPGLLDEGALDLRPALVNLRG